VRTPRIGRDTDTASVRSGTLKTVLIVSEVTVVLLLLGMWIFSDSVRASRNLFVLFFYSFPSEFLVGLIPHEPILIFYGNFYAPLTVALVSAVGTVMAEGINYSVFGYVYDSSVFDGFRGKAGVKTIVRLFARYPFYTILVAGFTPIPFFPVRFLVVMSRYSPAKYLAGVFVSRTPRFYLLALAGYAFSIPSWLLVTLFVVLFAMAYVPVIRGILSRTRS